MTAAEVDAILRSDPEWVRQNEEREAKHKAIVAQLQVELEPEESPILAELGLVGYKVSSVWDLVNTKATYAAAIPILVKYLPLAQHPVLRQGIARALTVKEACGVAGREILRELLAKKDPPGSEERWALANALTVTADKSSADDIKALITDPTYEDVHERLKAALRRLSRVP